MAWTAPITVIAGTAFTAAQWNVHIRDNLNACAPGVATTAGRWIVSTGLNTLAEREPQVDYIGNADTTDSLSFTDLNTFGPVLELETATTILLIISSRVSNALGGLGGRLTVEIDGATSLTAENANTFGAESPTTNDQFKGSWVTIYNELEAGTNRFIMKYRATGGGVATFSSRVLGIISF